MSTPSEIIGRVRKLAARKAELLETLIAPADAAVRALKDAKLNETAAALESVLFQIHASEQEIKEILGAVNSAEARAAVLLEALKPHPR